MEEMDGVNDGRYQVCRVLPEDTWPLRAAVLWPEKQPDGSCALPVDGAEGVFHLGVIHQGVVVGIGTFMPQNHRDLPHSIGHRLRAMATHPGHRGQGVGRMLIRHAEAELRASGFGGIWADARKVALGFYASLGWDVIGPFYEVPNRGPHRLVCTRFDA
jgi:GNAT superfamily N-acetyltransferase